MSDSSDLLKKADALLGRYRGGHKDVGEPDFPVLTDVVEEPGADPGKLFPPLPSLDPISAPFAAITEAELREVERRIIEQIHRSIDPYIENFLKELLRERLDEYLGRALLMLTEQIRAEFGATVREAVVQAVDRALADKREPVPRDGK